tara:strand:- start:348 stop:626 length:279 start_codon:yes stop_codon:yes gene_type:complete
MLNRYVILTYMIIPRDKSITSVKDWYKGANATQYNEQVSFKNNIKSYDLQSSKLILDTRTKEVVKNGFDTEITYNQAYNYLKKHYPKYFATV